MPPTRLAGVELPDFRPASAPPRHDAARLMSGHLVRLADGPIEVELLPAIGARLPRIRAFGRDLLRTPPDPASHRREPFSWGGYVMAPWCNRIPAVPTTVGDRVIRPRP